ncbi:ATP-binding protein [Sphaerisporangium sp. NPDC088356]|uniref:ATP-binding protein n=1 Tax=Sphaerisporangium sp. NPDC088356 TaxID=3154871 RepID=UPI00344317D8
MMTDEERCALEALRFNYVEGPGDVWRPSQFHVDGLHRRTAQTILDGLEEAGDSVEASPIGVILQGQRGTGKTHMLGWVREKVQRDCGGYFFLVGLLDARDFWDSVVVSMLDSLAREMDGESQLRMFLRRLSSLVGVPRLARRELIGRAPLTRGALDSFVEGLRRFDSRVGADAQDTARALVLRASDDLRAQDVGSTYLSSQPEEEPGERAQWGMRRSRKSPQEIVRDISRLLAFTGPSVIAVDQIDPLIQQASLTTSQDARQDWRQALVIEQIAGGLMSLREHTHRTLTVVSCIPVSWVLIEEAATDTVRDRFRQALPLMTIPDSKIGLNLVEKRFAERFRKAGFRPPYPTWPVKPSAFEDAPDFTPRQLLIKIDSHVQACLATGEVREMERLTDQIVINGGSCITGGSSAPSRELAVLETRFAELRDAADVTTVLDFTTEDVVMPELLSAGLTAWIAGQGEAEHEFSQDAPPSSKPPLHARLRRTLDESVQDEVHWCFRAINADNARAALNRLRTACVAAGLDAEVPKRRLFVLRNKEWSHGDRTQEAVTAFEKAGGRVLSVGDDDDLKVLVALRDLLAENPPNLHAWLVERKPAGDIKLFKETLGDNGDTPPGSAEDVVRFTGSSMTSADAGHPTTTAGNGASSSTAEEPAGNAWSVPTGRRDEASFPASPPAKKTIMGRAPSITIGTTITGDRPVSVELEALRKHTAIFAGSGSGKTVLIRRLVEECALQGVSSIVLDPNNDLARLGDGWPQEPPHWGMGDAGKAKDYLANTDVVVWTPLRDGGRPLSFQPLPDFSGVSDDPDEFREAVDAAVASIAPRAKLVGNTNKVHQGLAVLRETLRYYGRRGPTSLRGLIDVLAALPDGVSELLYAEKLAADIAQNLTAAMVNDPLFGGAGVPMDPGILLTPPEGKRARVSVISLVGLPSDDQRQSFVNQLQMALFAWIKKNPAGDRPLGGLFVMDEAQTFAPSGAMTACTHSTLALASQARKYGLGLVFATQAPRGLHNRIPGNSATQFFGLLNSPTQIDAAREMAQAKGSHITDIGRLSTGQFYAAVEGARFEKMQAPLCLSHHPKSPLTTEEVIGRARRSMEAGPA